MKATEFLTEKFVIKDKIGGIEYGIGDHFMTQWQLPERKHITWNQITRIIKRIPYIKPKLLQMINFNKFYLRDSETGVELGCKFTTFGKPEVLLLYINTVVSTDHVRKSDTPVIVVNGPVKSLTIPQGAQ